MLVSAQYLAECDSKIAFVNKEVRAFPDKFRAQIVDWEASAFCDVPAHDPPSF